MTVIAVSLISPIVAILIAAWGFRRSSLADALRSFFEIYSQYIKPDVREGRRLIHRVAAAEHLQPLSEIDRVEMDLMTHCLAMLNAIAIAIECGYVDKELVLRTIGHSYKSTVTTARVLIDMLEADHGRRPYRFAEALAAEL